MMAIGNRTVLSLLVDGVETATEIDGKNVTHTATGLMGDTVIMSDASMPPNKYKLQAKETILIKLGPVK